MKLDLYLALYTKIDSKQIKDLNLMAKTTKLLEKNIGDDLHDTCFGIYSLVMTPRA